MSKMSIQVMCMLCPERATVHGEASESAALAERLYRETRAAGWHRHEREHSDADVCPKCFELVGQAYVRKQERAVAEEALRRCYGGAP